MALGDQVFGARLGRDRQQPGRERHSPDGRGQEELDVFRLGRSRPAQRGNLYPGGKLPPAWPGSLRLSQRRVGTPADDEKHRSRTTHPVELEKSPAGAGQAIRLTSSPKQLHCRSYPVPPLPLTPTQQMGSMA